MWPSSNSASSAPPPTTNVLDVYHWIVSATSLYRQHEADKLGKGEPVIQSFRLDVTKFTFSTQPHLDHRTYSHRFEPTLLATRHRYPIKFNSFISCLNQHPQQGRMPTAKATSPTPIQQARPLNEN